MVILRRRVPVLPQAEFTCFHHLGDRKWLQKHRDPGVVARKPSMAPARLDVPLPGPLRRDQEALQCDVLMPAILTLQWLLDLLLRPYQFDLDLPLVGHPSYLERRLLPPPAPTVPCIWFSSTGRP